MDEEQLKHAIEWESATGIRIISPEGWGFPNPRNFEERINLREFVSRSVHSVCALTVKATGIPTWHVMWTKGPGHWAEEIISAETGTMALESVRDREPDWHQGYANPTKDTITYLDQNPEAKSKAYPTPNEKPKQPK